MKLLLSNIALSLIILLSAVQGYADNLIFVNTEYRATVHVRAKIHDKPFSYVDCRGRDIDRILQPGEVYVHYVPKGCETERLTFDMGTRHLAMHGGRSRGLYVIGPIQHDGFYNVGYYSYAGRGPLVGTLYLVNATGSSMKYHAEYGTFFCGTDRGDLGYGETVELQIGACETKLLYGYNIAIGVGMHAKTNEFKAGVGKGTFVFRRKQGTNDQFEVVGPFRE